MRAKTRDRREILREGAQTALGIMIGWGLVIPALGLFGFWFGFASGLVSSILVLLVYYLKALRQAEPVRVENHPS